MKKAINIISALLITISTTACHKDKIWVVGKGGETTEVRNVSNFSGIELKMSANVEYIQDSIYKVEVTAQSNLLPVIETMVYGTVLTIDNKAWISGKSLPITVVIHAPDMNKLRVSGSGNIHSKTAINTTSMEVAVSGSGNVSIPSVTAQNMNCKISGSGDIKIEGGSVSKEVFSISGSGNISTQELMSDDCVVTISGSGDATVQAVKTLDVTISGSGNVKYKGNPIVTTRITGSGKIIHL